VSRRREDYSHTSVCSSVEIADRRRLEHDPESRIRLSQRLML
jgi:hypothetical protein